MRAFLTGLPGAMACLFIPAALPAAAPGGDHQLHPAERAHRRGDRGPSRAGGDPDGLVQGRRRRRPGRAVGPRALPRAPDVQGDRHARRRRVQPDGGGERRRGQRLHHRPTTPPTSSASPPTGSTWSWAMEADRMTDLDPGEAAVLSERDVVARGAAAAGRERARRPVRRADATRRSTSTALRPAGDRLGARDRGLHPRGGHGLLPRALRARTTRSWWWPATSSPAEVAAARRGALRADPGLAGDRAARPPAGADAGGGAAGRDAGRRACASPTSCGATSRRAQGRRPGARPRR